MSGPRDAGGQLAAFDAMMFLAILLVASALILGVSTNLRHLDDVTQFNDLYALATMTSNALLTTTVPDASYIDGMGNIVVSRDISVLDMMVEELVMLKAGIPKAGFEGPGRYNHRIEQTLTSLVDEDRYGFRLIGSYDGASVSFGGAIENEDVASTTTEVYYPGTDQSVRIALSLWAC